MALSFFSSNKNLEVQVGKMDAEMLNLKTELHKARQGAEDEKAKREQLADQVENFRDIVGHLNQQCDVRNKDRKKQDATINALKSHLQHAKTQVEALKARREEEMQSIAKDKEVQVEGVAAQIAELKARLAKETASAEQLADEANTALDERDNWRNLVTSLQAELASANGQLTELKPGLQGNKQGPQCGIGIEQAAEEKENSKGEGYERRALPDDVENILTVPNGQFPRAGDPVTGNRSLDYEALLSNLCALQEEASVAQQSKAELARKLHAMEMSMRELQSRLDEAVDTCKETMEVAEYQEGTIEKLEEEVQAEKTQAELVATRRKEAEEDMRRIDGDLHVALNARQQLAVQIESHGSHIGEVQAGLGDCMGAKEEADRRVEVLGMQLGMMRQELEEAVSEKVDVEARLGAQTERSSSLEAAVGEAQARVEALHKEVGGLQLELATAIRVAEDSQAAVVAIEGDLRNAQAALQASTTDMADKSSQSERLLKVKEAAFATLTAANEQVEELKAKLAEAEDAAESEETRYHSSEWTVQHLAQELDKAKQLTFSKEQEVRSVQEAMMELQHQLGIQEYRHERMGSKVDKFQGQVVSLQKRVMILEAELVAANERLEEAKQREVVLEQSLLQEVGMKTQEGRSAGEVVGVAGVMGVGMAMRGMRQPNAASVSEDVEEGADVTMGDGDVCKKKGGALELPESGEGGVGGNEAQGDLQFMSVDLTEMVEELQRRKRSGDLETKRLRGELASAVQQIEHLQGELSENQNQYLSGGAPAAALTTTDRGQDRDLLPEGTGGCVEVGEAKEDVDVGMQWEGGGLRDEKDSWHSADEGESQETLGENAEETVTNVDDVDMGGAGGAKGGDGMGQSEPLIGAERGGDVATTPAAATIVEAGLRVKMNPVPIAFKCLSCRSGQATPASVITTLTPLCLPTPGSKEDMPVAERRGGFDREDVVRQLSSDLAVEAQEKEQALSEVRSIRERLEASVRETEVLSIRAEEGGKNAAFREQELVNMQSTLEVLRAEAGAREAQMACGEQRRGMDLAKAVEEKEVLRKEVDARVEEVAAVRAEVGKLKAEIAVATGDMAELRSKKDSASVVSKVRESKILVEQSKQQLKEAEGHGKEAERDLATQRLQLAKAAASLREERKKRAAAESKAEALQAKVEELNGMMREREVRRVEAKGLQGEVEKQVAESGRIEADLETELKGARVELRKQMDEKLATEQRMKGLEKAVDRWREFESLARKETSSKRQELELAGRLLSDAGRENEKREDKEQDLAEEIKRLQGKIVGWERRKGELVGLVEKAKQEAKQSKEVITAREVELKWQKERGQALEAEVAKEKGARERERRELHLTLATLEGSAKKAKKDKEEAEARMAEMVLKTGECVRQKESAEEELKDMTTAVEIRVVEEKEAAESVRVQHEELVQGLMEERSVLERRVREVVEKGKKMEELVGEAEGQVGVHEMQALAAKGESGRMARQLEATVREREEGRREVEGLKTELDAALEERGAMVEEVENLKEKVKEIEEVVEGLKNEIGEGRASVLIALEEKQSEGKSLHGDVGELRERVAQLEGTVKEKTEEIEKLEAWCRKAESEMAAETQSRGEVESTIESLEGKVGEVEERATQAKSALVEKEERVGSLMEEIEGLKEDKSEMVEEAGRVSERVGEVEAGYASLIAGKLQAEKEGQEWRVSLEESGAVVEGLRVDIAEERGRVAALQALMSGVKDKDMCEGGGGTEMCEGQKLKSAAEVAAVGVGGEVEALQQDLQAAIMRVEEQALEIRDLCKQIEVEGAGKEGGEEGQDVGEIQAELAERTAEVKKLTVRLVQVGKEKGEAEGLMAVWRREAEEVGPQVEKLRAKLESMERNEWEDFVGGGSPIDGPGFWEEEAKKYVERCDSLVRENRNLKKQVELIEARATAITSGMKWSAHPPSPALLGDDESRRKLFTSPLEAQKPIGALTPAALIPAGVEEEKERHAEGADTHKKNEVQQRGEEEDKEVVNGAGGGEEEVGEQQLGNVVVSRLKAENKRLSEGRVEEESGGGCVEGSRVDAGSESGSDVWPGSGEGAAAPSATTSLRRKRSVGGRAGAEAGAGAGAGVGDDDSGNKESGGGGDGRGDGSPRPPKRDTESEICADVIVEKSPEPSTSEREDKGAGSSGGGRDGRGTGGRSGRKMGWLGLWGSREKEGRQNSVIKSPNSTPSPSKKLRFGPPGAPLLPM